MKKGPTTVPEDGTIISLLLKRKKVFPFLLFAKFRPVSASAGLIMNSPAAGRSGSPFSLRGLIIMLLSIMFTKKIVHEKLTGDSYKKG